MTARKLSIALLSRSNGLGGGASRIAEELAGLLVQSGHNAVHYCAEPVGTLRDFQASLFSSDVQNRLQSYVNRFARWLGLNTIIPFEYLTEIRKIVRNFNIIHFHDLATAISPMTLGLCAKRKPVLVTAHDCSTFTGGCIYPLGCERYRCSCGACPQLTRMGARVDFTAVRLGISRSVAKRKEIQFVFPSQWLRDLALRSVSFGRKPEVIPNGFAPEPYKVCGKLDARRELGLQQEERIIVVAAHFLGEPRKGVSLALSALRTIADLNPLIIFVGIPLSDLECRIAGLRFWQTGFVRDKGKLGALFSAADVFLFSSLQENLPIMIQEAMTAGTPVVGFAAGGVPEMVEDQRNGWLCVPGDPLALARKLRDALLCTDRAMFGLAAQQTMAARFGVKAFVERHLEMYERMAIG